MSRDAVDNYNSTRHDRNTHAGTSLENLWKTHRWATRVFSFVLAVTLVNAHLFYLYFLDKDEIIVQFHKKLAHELFFNNMMNEKGEGASRFRRNRS